jgi:hypothetical protein
LQFSLSNPKQQSARFHLQVLGRFLGREPFGGGYFIEMVWSHGHGFIGGCGFFWSVFWCN